SPRFSSPLWPRETLALFHTPIVRRDHHTGLIAAEEIFSKVRPLPRVGPWPIYGIDRSLPVRGRLVADASGRPRSLELATLGDGSALRHPLERVTVQFKRREAHVPAEPAESSTIETYSSPHCAIPLPSGARPVPTTP